MNRGKSRKDCFIFRLTTQLKGISLELDAPNVVSLSSRGEWYVPAA